MQIKKVTEEANRFYTENVVNEEKNHLTGHIEQTYVSKQTFEQGFRDHNMQLD